MKMVFLGGLGETPTFLVPIINPPFADNSPQKPQLLLSYWFPFRIFVNNLDRNLKNIFPTPIPLNNLGRRQFPFLPSLDQKNRPIGTVALFNNQTTIKCAHYHGILIHFHQGIF